MTSAIIRIGVNPPTPEVVTDPASGAAVTTTFTYYTDPEGRFTSGEWRSNPVKADINYTEDEFIYVLEGRCRLTSTAGVAETFGPGDSFIIPRGFQGTWETLEPMRKLFAIYNPPSGS
jgi:uncharacterized cupin superfamily protein